MSDEIKYIAKVKLSDNSIHIVKDINALHLSGGTLTGDLSVDTKITTHHLYILEIEYIEERPTNVLVQDEESGEIKKRSTDKLLEDIGGISCNVDETTGTLSLKLGK